MRPYLLIRVFALLVCWGASTLAVRASHILSVDLTYEYTGTAANPYQYRVRATLYQDLNSSVTDNQMQLTCGRNECSSTQVGSFTTMLQRTSPRLPAGSCGAGPLYYSITVLEGQVQLPPALWTLSVNTSNRRYGLLNMSQPWLQSYYVQALLDNRSGLVNTSPRFAPARLIDLTDAPGQRYSMHTFDADGDSLVYELVQPQADSEPSVCGYSTVGAIAPQFLINQETGELLYQPVPVRQGYYALAVQVNEYRQVNGRWQQIGSVRRDTQYQLRVGTNQPPVFTRVTSSSNPAVQLQGQTLRVNPGQTITLNLTATDADAGQVLELRSDDVGLVPGLMFQDLGNGQGQLSWQVPATLSPGLYVLTATASDSFCPTVGAAVQTIPFRVTRQTLGAARPHVASIVAYPSPFDQQVRFQLIQPGIQPLLIIDQLGRTVARLQSTPEGSVVWQPAGVSPGLYLARTLDGTQVARLAYSGR
ncbi:hypothetical protein GCM10023185_25480 [Hymenobacter saemangeumensis]|uniref:T9SS type A sorting domain-containing protein n=1 Tax=Hymenobacter saemangeumensis TaxID=1084522 RepID=A0ABP8IHT6_9BACT